MDGIKLIEVGVDGGGIEVYRLPNGRILAITGGGGMLDEDEDPFFFP